MVTMRRDVAVTKNWSEDGIGMTPYDRFMMKKSARRTPEFVSEDTQKYSVPTTGNYKNNESIFGAKATENINNVAKGTQSEYDLYLLEQLNSNTRTAPLLSEEEFYRRQTSAARSAEKQPKTVTKKKKETRPGQLSKLGKIILSVYVLVMVMTAFTLIAVNVFKDPVTADAKENVTTGERVIRPMTVEKLDSEEGNWFDSLCDAVKK